MVVLLLVLQLLVLPGTVFAQGKEAASLQPEKSLNANISVGKEPKQANENEADYRDPSNYPLIGEEGYIAVYLNSYLSKSDYANQPYIYMRVGVSRSPADTYYSGVTIFRVVNPFYSGSPESDVAYAVISNESTNGDSTEPTGCEGDFSLKFKKGIPEYLVKLKSSFVTNLDFYLDQ
ncbi:hypothetical protein [Bacillus sp. AFS073361]|uniref:hypothetical protein n=1 Tax=Bacillus sp. AFS073361 TaxID=2033511 RepID=UPI0015D49ED0|nr:hypothetical protein [Bacillus sp. AFS073361]